MSTSRASIRRLEAGSELPPGKPLRYRTTDGYICLRWWVAPRTYVEVLEHRVVDSRVVSTPEEVHHRNRDRSDNHPDNLVPLSKLDHEGAHSAVNMAMAVAMYQEGKTLAEIGRYFGRHHSTISRMFGARGIAIRKSPWNKGARS